MVRQSYLPGGGFLADNGVGGCPPIRPALGLGDAGQLRAVRRRPVTNRPLLPGGHPVDSRRMRPVRGHPRGLGTRFADATFVGTSVRQAKALPAAERTQRRVAPQQRRADGP